MSLLRSLRLSAPGRYAQWAFHFVRRCFVRMLNRHAVRAYAAHRQAFVLSAPERGWLDELRRNGIVLIEGLFDEQRIAAIHHRLEQLLANPANLDRANVNAYNHERKLRLEAPLDRIPDLVDLVFNETVCKIAAVYKGFVPVHVFNVYKTLPGDRLSGSSYFHRDELGDMSVFVYLHDVDAHSGASVFVRGSHGYTPRSCSLRSNFEKGLADANPAYSDAEVERLYPRSAWAQSIARRGAVVMADVTGIHKGPFWDLHGDGNVPRSVVHVVFRQKNLFRSGYVPPRHAPEALLAQLGSAGRLVSRQYADA